MNYINTTILFLLAVMGMFIYQELQKPVDIEALRVQECDVELAGNEAAQLKCNAYYYSINESRI